MAMITWSKSEENKTTVDGDKKVTILVTSIDW